MYLCIKQGPHALIKTYLPRVTHPLISACNPFSFLPFFPLFHRPLLVSFVWLQPCQNCVRGHHRGSEWWRRCENGGDGYAAQVECEEFSFFFFHFFQSSFLSLPFSARAQSKLPVLLIVSGIYPIKQNDEPHFHSTPPQITQFYAYLKHTLFNTNNKTSDGFQIQSAADIASTAQYCLKE